MNWLLDRSVKYAVKYVKCPVIFEFAFDVYILAIEMACSLRQYNNDLDISHIIPDSSILPKILPQCLSEEVTKLAKFEGFFIN